MKPNSTGKPRSAGKSKSAGKSSGKPRPSGKAKSAAEKDRPSKLRIIGGDMRGRPVTYHGAEFTRPMRDSVRENLFNILGRGVRGTIAFDLFAGTGVLAFEALSRGAVRAIAVEPVRQAIVQIRRTAEKLDVNDKFTLVASDAFFVADQLLTCSPGDDTPWVVFLSPPYSFWNDPQEFPKLAAIIRRVQSEAPPGSILVAETDFTFDLEKLPPAEWDIRAYGITRLAFCEPGNVCGLRM